jgi:hypothetical protein
MFEQMARPGLLLAADQLSSIFGCQQVANSLKSTTMNTKATKVNQVESRCLTFKKITETFRSNATFV